MIVVAYSTIGFASDKDAESKSRVEIINTLEKWAKNFNAKNIKEVSELFSPDLVFSHQGTADKNYEELCSQLKAKLARPDKKYFYEAPKIEQVYVEENLAAVNLVWTLKVSSNHDTETEVSKAKSLDIFKRQPDGSWKMVAFLSYTEKD